MGRFVTQLEKLGFDRVADDTNERVFGNRLLVFRRSPFEVRLTRDRGQWQVDATADEWPEEDRIFFPLFHGFALGDS